MIPAPVGHQCPECVAEARREYRQGPGRQVAVANLKATPVTKILLIAIAIGYVWELIIAGGPGSLFEGPSGQALIDAGALVPYSGGTIAQPIGGIVGGEYWRLVTSIFLHAGIIHLALNAYVLWIFGTTLERDIGRLPTMAVFLVTGVFAAAVSFAFAPGFTIGVGASGAIFGLVGAFVAHSYLRRSNLLAQARLRSALSLLLINLVFGLVAREGIDWRAHVGGFVAGLVAGYVVDPSRPPAIRRIAATTGLLALLVAAAALVAFRSSQISADPSILFAS
jgi:membrane associated rhomboid family serine protease